MLAEWPWRTSPGSAWLLSSVVDAEASPGLSVGCLEVCLIRVPKRKICPALKNKLCFHAGVTVSGFPFDFGRAPYKGKRPLKDMIGSYRNRHSSSDPLTEGTSGSGGAGKPEVQLQVQSQQEEVEQLKKDLSSQKVPFPLHIPLLSPPPHTQAARGLGGVNPGSPVSLSRLSQSVLFPGEFYVHCSHGLCPGPWFCSIICSETSECPRRVKTPGGSAEGVVCTTHSCQHPVPVHLSPESTHRG